MTQKPAKNPRKSPEMLNLTDFHKFEYPKLLFKKYLVEWKRILRVKEYLRSSGEKKCIFSPEEFTGQLFHEH